MSFSKATAQTYTIGDYLVRTIPNNFQDISGSGLDISADIGFTENDLHLQVSLSEYTIPFNFRWINYVSNKIKVTGNGSIVLGGHAEWPAEKVTGITDYYYLYAYNKNPYSTATSTQQQGANNMLIPWAGWFDATINTRHHLAVVGTAPNRRVIVQTSRVQHNYWTGAPAIGSHQVVLFESGISRVEYHYRNDQPGVWNSTGSYTYGPWIGATGWEQPPGTTSSVRTEGPAGSVMLIKGTPAPGGTPNVYYENTPTTTMSHYTGTHPSVGYRIFIAYPYDLAATGITNPILDQIRSKDVAFIPQGTIANEGSSVPTAAVYSRRITLLGVGEVYNESVSITPPAAFSSGTINFPSFTPLAFGVYRDTMELISTTPADQYAGNNVAFSSFVVSPPHNMRAVAITNPFPESRTPINVPTPVSATFRNIGTSDEVNVPVTLVITDPAGEVVYRDTLRIPRLASLAMKDTFFQEWTPTMHGTYRICAIPIMPSDELRTDDTTCANVYAAYEADLAASVVVSPEPDEEKPEKKVFKVFAKFRSVGVADLFDIPARVQIRRCSDNGLVFQADSIIQAVNVDQGDVTFGFPTRQGAYDVTKLAPGCYNVCVIARYSTDGDRANDTSCTTFSIIPRLQGNIEVGKGRRFRTISAAIDSMRFRGVGGNLNLILTDAYYRESNNTSVSSDLYAALDFADIVGTGENARVTWMPKRGVSPRIAIYGNASFAFYFGKGSPGYITFDGMNQLAPTPELRVQDPLKRGITIVDSSSVAGSTFAIEHGFANNLTFKNLNVIGRGNLNSDSSSVFRLYNERSLATFSEFRITDTMPNHHIVIENNQLGNARYGIWDRGLQPLFSVGPA
ncbi:MAG TPA: hypothetical protein VFH43_10330, partial [Candidatus Kapabacteria bacterium]|nr:hypothetical protein [Candidatus Kapabacteria bacterium]